MKIKINKIVYSGQGLGTLESGKKIFCWNSLPDETVDAAIISDHSKFCIGYATTVIEKSAHRICPKDSCYLSTSPWQIMDTAFENKTKQLLLAEIYKNNEEIDTSKIKLAEDDVFYNYRNKFEYSILINNNKAELAVKRRDSHQLIKIITNSITKDVIQTNAENIINIVNTCNIQEKITSMVLRSSQDNNIIFEIIVNDKKYDYSNLIDNLLKKYDKFKIVYAKKDKKLPIYLTKTTYIVDSILDKPFRYNIDSFFQINLPVYRQAIDDIAQNTNQSLPAIDLFSGVGSIGLSLPNEPMKLIEINQDSLNDLKFNISALCKNNSQAIRLSDSKMNSNYLSNNNLLIVDPPRAGLSSNLIKLIQTIGPKQIAYLSCNPMTQARDYNNLKNFYQANFIKGYNFFPRTPHIESLMILDRKN